METLKRIILTFTALCAVTGISTVVAMKVSGLDSLRLVTEKVLQADIIQEMATSVAAVIAPSAPAAPVKAPTQEVVRQSGAVLAETQGTVRVMRAGVPVRLAANLELLQGDLVAVDASSTAAIVYPGYGRSIIDGGSSVQVGEATTDAAHASLRVRLLLNAGRIWTRLQRTLGADSNFSVRASNVVATVRGTSFGVERRGDVVDVKVMESHVAVTKLVERPASLQEVASGQATPEGKMEVALAPPVSVGPQETVETVARTTKEVPVPVLMSAPEISEPFIQVANTIIPTEVIQLEANAPAPVVPVIPPTPVINVPTPELPHIQGPGAQQVPEARPEVVQPSRPVEQPELPKPQTTPTDAKPPAATLRQPEVRTPETPKTTERPTTDAKPLPSAEIRPEVTPDTTVPREVPKPTTDQTTKLPTTDTTKTEPVQRPVEVPKTETPTLPSPEIVMPSPALEETPAKTTTSTTDAEIKAREDAAAAAAAEEKLKASTTNTTVPVTTDTGTTIRR